MKVTPLFLGLFLATARGDKASWRPSGALDASPGLNDPDPPDPVRFCKGQLVR